VLGGIAVDVVDLERAVAGRKVSGRIGIGAAVFPTAPIAAGGLDTAGCTDAALVGRAVAPTLVVRVGPIVSRAHRMDAVLR